MTSKKPVNEMNVGSALIGFQVPPEARKKLEAAMDAFNLKNEDKTLLFFRLDEQFVSETVKKLDEGKLLEAGQSIADKIEENNVRKLVSEKLKEVVRKKKGGGGFTLYSPNKGKKNPSKPVGTFPTKLQAKQAELARFPPKDIAKLKRLRHDVERLKKDPKKAAEKEKDWMQPKKAKAHHGAHHAPAKHRAEGIEHISEAVNRLINEALFNEEETEGSRWDERMSRLSKGAIEADKKLQGLQKNIEKKGESVIQTAFSAISKALKPRKMTAKSSGVKKDQARQKTFLQFSVDVNGSEVGPFYIFVENGKPKIEISAEAKAKMTKIEPENTKLLRAELITAQENALDMMDDVADAVSKRDGYLDKLESKVDGFVAGLNALEISVLKNLLVQKYRGK